eukprot:4387262-Prymnesium_polylepis.1
MLVRVSARHGTAGKAQDSTTHRLGTRGPSPAPKLHVTSLPSYHAPKCSMVPQARRRTAQHGGRPCAHVPQFPPPAHL